MVGFFRERFGTILKVDREQYPGRGGLAPCNEGLTFWPQPAFFISSRKGALVSGAF